MNYDYLFMLALLPVIKKYAEWKLKGQKANSEEEVEIIRKQVAASVTERVVQYSTIRGKSTGLEDKKIIQGLVEEHMAPIFEEWEKEISKSWSGSRLASSNIGSNLEDKEISQDQQQQVLEKYFTDTEKRFDIRTFLTIESSTNFSPFLTVDFAKTKLVPFIEAIIQYQKLINEMMDLNWVDERIFSVTQNSPIEIGLGDVGQAAQSIQEDVIPWRRKHAQQMAEISEQDAQLEIELKRAQILEARAKATQAREQAKQLELDYKRKQLEIERLAIENEHAKSQLHQERIKLAMEIMERVNPTLSEEQKISMVVRLLDPLKLITESDLEITNVKQLPDNLA